MKFQLTVAAGFILLFSIAFLGASVGLTQTTANGLAIEPNIPAMSDREQNGLRGPVKTCLEEVTHLGMTAADGTRMPEVKFSQTTTYDAEGRMIATGAHNSDGSEWVTRFTYDASGRLLKKASGKEGESAPETVYSYDSLGRLLNITNSHAPENPVQFRYDEHGRKTKIQVSRAADYLPNTGVAGSLFEAADMAPNLPDGGSTTTIYDEHDRATEVQVRDSQGELVSRVVRIYDRQGRIAEEKQIWDHPEAIIPASARAKILEESGASLEDLREQITKAMGGQTGPFSSAYSYDTQGRIKQMRRRIFDQEEIIETTYNEHGDVAAEITRGTQGNSAQEDNSSPTLAPFSEARHSYQYDSRGNWTEEILSYRSSPGDAFESSTQRRRTLTYY